MIGNTILQYRILSKLGEGGMGVVYKAHDTRLDREVALKFLPAGSIATEEEKARFEQEAKAAARLSHANIAMVFDFNEHEGRRFIAMEYIDGETLADRIQLGPLPLADAIEIARQIARGLQAAHEREIVHRDIKPANILLTEKGQVKITDFGLAKLAGRTQLTREGTSMGTAAYMSPEQAQGVPVDHRTDIWALGAILYEMITGRQPFAGDFEQAMIYSIMNEDPEPPTALRTGVPMELERITLKALAKGAGERYQHVEDMAVDLKGVPLMDASYPVKTKSGEKAAGAAVDAMPDRSKQPVLIAAIAVVALLAVLAVYLLRPTEPGSDASRKSIAVLPFTDMSAEQDQEYFSDGITEDIISRIAKISDLRVISRTSVMQYKNSMKSIREIAEELNVATILEGSVRRSEDQIRIVAQLIDAKNDENLWSETYDRELKQIFAIQSEVAQEIGRSLQAELSPKEEQSLALQPTEDLEAYALYLKSRHHFLKYTQGDFEQGIELAQQAIARDPGYGLAYTALAEAYYRAATLYLPSIEAMPKAKEAALKALKLDQTLARAYMALAVISYRWDHDWDEAEERFKQALDLSPGDATIHEEYGASFLMGQGRFAEALAQLRHALNLDPYSGAINMKLQMTYYFKGDYQLSLEQSDYLLSLSPDYATCQAIRGLTLEQLGRHEAAIASYATAQRNGYSADLINAYMASSYFHLGDTRKAGDLLAAVKQRAAEQPDMYYQLARSYSAIGNKKEALYWLDKAYDMKNEFLMWMKVDPTFENIRDETRYQEVLTKVGLAP